MFYKKPKLFLFKNCFHTKHLEDYTFKNDITSLICKYNNNVIISTPYLYTDLLAVANPSEIIKLNKQSAKLLDSHLYEHQQLIFAWILQCHFEYLNLIQISFFGDRYDNDGYEYIEKYFVQYSIQNSLLTKYPKSKQTKTLLSNILNKTYHFLLQDCEQTRFDSVNFRYLYPEIYLAQTDSQYCMEGNALITTDNKQFLKKCISQFKPANIKILNRSEYKEYTSNTKLYYIISRGC